MARRPITIRRLLYGITAASLPLIALGTLATWVMAPYATALPITYRAAEQIVQAPFAERIVIGDSRIEFAEPVPDALLIGYAGAPFAQMERMIRIVCAVSDAPVVIALGVNDAIPQWADVDASIASALRAIAACGAERVTISGIWPPDPEIGPLGSIYDLEVLAQLDSRLAKTAQQSGAAYIPVPEGLIGHTIDGAHFAPDVSRRYVALLVSAAER